MTREVEVEILLEPGTRLPRWMFPFIRGVPGRGIKPRMDIRRGELGGRRVRSLKIYGGDASFFVGGAVDILPPGHGNWVRAFEPMKVLSIRDSAKGTATNNHYLCTQCQRLTGKKTGAHRPSSQVAGREDTDFKCTKCGHEYELKAI